MRSSRLIAWLGCLLLVCSTGIASGDEDSGWLYGVQQQIAEEEYRVTWQDRTQLADLDAAWQAPNRAHGFRTYFTRDGIRVIPRIDGAKAWGWGLALAGQGRGGNVWPVSAASTHTHENRLDYERTLLREWYVNDRRGLEQGFTLWEPPEGSRTSASMAIAPRGPRTARLSGVERKSAAFVQLELSTTLQPHFSSDGQSIDFRTSSGVGVLHYDELLVTDATGRELRSWMEGFAEDGSQGIRLVFDDADAVYPVTIDPLLSSPAWIAESNQDSARFGAMVATAGDVNGDGYSDVVVGAFLYDNGEAQEGRAYVYHGSAAGLSTVADWTAEGDQSDALYGEGAGTAGDVNGDGFSDLIVGARQYDDDQTDEGRAYVYYGSATGLSASEDWSADGDQDGASFGFAVGTAGDVNGDGYSDVIVGSPGFGNGEAQEGRALVYLGSAGGLAASPSWTAEVNQAVAVFGTAVGTAGDVNADGYADVIVGAYLFDNGETDEGGAFVYHGSAAGLSGTPAWTAESEQASALFGIAAATAGDVNGDGYADVVVSAYIYDGANIDAGRAYLYHGSAAGLETTASWTGDGEHVEAGYGIRLATAGDVNGDGYADIAVGAYLHDRNFQNEGKVYVYHGSSGGLSSAASWTVVGNQFNARLGRSVGTAGDVNGDGYSDLIAGAEAYTNGEVAEGRAYVYLGAAAGLGSSTWSKEGNQADAQFSHSVNTAGDVNGDGFADVIIGSPYYDNGEADEGIVQVYHGSAAGLETIAFWTAESDQAGARFGHSAGTAGDVNGDGYADVVVGSLHYDNGETNEGRAFLYHGSDTGIGATPAWTAESDQAYAEFGHSVATAGDVDGDGYADIVVGARYYDGGEVDEGRVYVYHGSAAGVSTTPAFVAESNQEIAGFGHSAGTAGDVNGDGYADIIVGAFGYDNGETDEGRIYVYYGSATGVSSSAPWTAESDYEFGWLGRSVGTAGDVNGDGYADVIAGAPLYENGEINEGGAFLYLGSSTGPATSANWMVEGDNAGAKLGSSVGTGGDLNGDGYADVLVTAPQYTNGEGGEGRAMLYLGSALGLGALPSWIVESNQVFASLGGSAGTAGDINGDGYADVIVGAPSYDNGETNEGRAFVFYGNGGAGLALRPQQRRADDTAPIARGGHSRTPGQFRLAATGRSPFGRARVKMEWEIKLRGEPLDGTNTETSASWLDTGTAGVEFNELISGLDPGDLHWRVRFLYDAATSPFQQASRWFSVPWGGMQETDLTVAAFLGGVVWEDLDGDGLRETGEPLLGGVSVQLLDSSGVPVDAAFTDGSGAYRFEVDHTSDHSIRFILPAGYLFTVQGQGTDDTLDSDADVISGETVSIGPPLRTWDVGRWGAGIVQEACAAPTDPVDVYQARLSADGNDYPIFDFQDPNPPGDVTGYNVYRSSEAMLPFGSWPLVASDVADMDLALPDMQWVDTTGDFSPSGSWHYQVLAFNAACGAEGPK